MEYLERCRTCKHEYKSVNVSPCDTCKWANSADNWESKERPKPKRKDLGRLLKRMDELAEIYQVN